MKVFLSWSKEVSGKVALALRDWLPSVIQSVEPWLSKTDISAGSGWPEEMAAALKEARFGVLCLNSVNLNDPWILFEAGALWKALDSNSVCPYLFGMEPANLGWPLARFQAMVANREGTQALVAAINKALGEKARSESILGRTFEVWWPQLDASLQAVGRAHPAPAPPKRSERELLEELLDLVRSLDRRTPSPPVPEWPATPVL
jgi:hypothetical protein